MTQEILICYDGSNDAERAIDAAAAFLGPRNAVVLNVAPAMTFAEGVAATSSLVPGSRALHGFRGFARGSVSHDAATHARRPVLIVPPVTT